MEPQEVVELEEAASDHQKRVVGLTTAVGAALLAVVTLMGHRLHTEEIVMQTKAADGWAYYQAKNSRYHMYAADAKLATLIGPQGSAVAVDWERKADEEKRQAEEVRRANEQLDEETVATARRALLFDAAEVCLEVAIVLSSITLLTGRLGYWRASFVGSGIGVLIALYGLFR
jgi:hypothetical protein